MGTGVGPPEHRPSADLYPARGAVPEEGHEQRLHAAPEQPQDDHLSDADAVLDEHRHPDERGPGQGGPGPDQPRQRPPPPRRPAHAATPRRPHPHGCSVAGRPPVATGRRARAGRMHRARAAPPRAASRGRAGRPRRASGPAAGRATRRAAAARRGSSAGTRPRRPARAPPSARGGRARAGRSRRRGSSGGPAGAGGAIRSSSAVSRNPVPTWPR